MANFVLILFLVSRQQKLSLYLSSICHDIDHRGYNNAFMIKQKTPLSHLYSTSTLEWHHFKQGVFILEVGSSVAHLYILESMETVRITKFCPTKNQSENMDLPKTGMALPYNKRYTLSTNFVAKTSNMFMKVCL